jgi:hypothetical protein
MAIASYKGMESEAMPVAGETRQDPPGRKHFPNARREASMHRYAWLEHEDGKWHLLTSLFADPGESTRRWSDKQCALDELMNEGWTVVRPYPEKPVIAKRPGGCLCGYGLIRSVH